ncbi:MAG: SDR family NAD(P)-dependent oxidoreductase [Deltaproteobacteria bacterium]|jgi:benzil reductase ((S)-benzoin forming)|nr:SDR family NAD(P)-dependent oxidoreductase [Deltaproteobacteria bacterium]
MVCNKNKLAFITGASRGLGKNLALTMLENNWEVHGFARSEIKITHPCFTAKSKDLSRPDKLKEIFTETRKNLNDYKSIVLVNNAGTISPTGPLEQLKPEQISVLINLNLTTPLLLMGEFGRLTGNLKNITRTIINISSGAGKHPYQGWVPYCTSKAGIDMATEAFALEQGEEGIKIISFSPGVMDTKMQSQIRNLKPEIFPSKNRFLELKRQNLLSSPIKIAKYLLNKLEQQSFEQGAITTY